jgi:serine/threonine protein kinase
MDWTSITTPEQALSAIYSESLSFMDRFRPARHREDVVRKFLVDRIVSLLLVEDGISEQILANLHALYKHAAGLGDSAISGPVGLFFVLHNSSIASAVGETASTELDDSQAFLADSATQRALKQFYQIPDDYDLTKARIHRIGTTSMVIQCNEKQSGELATSKKIALKCVLPQYFAIKSIREGTLLYQARHGIDHPAVARVYASSERYVSMDFIEGPTLAEYLDRSAVSEPRINSRLDDRQQQQVARQNRIDRRLNKPDIERVRGVGLALCAILGDLATLGRRHLDLSPSNIIVREVPGSSAVQFTLIDFGHNYALTEKPGSSPAFRNAAVYVDPQLIERDPNRDDWRSDLYSLGIILLETAAKRRIQSDAIQHELDRLWEGDSEWEGAPGFARVIEELIDDNPDYRLIFGPASETGAETYRYLFKLIDQETDVLNVYEERTGSSSFGTLRGIGLLKGWNNEQVKNLVQAPKRLKDPVDDSYAHFPTLSVWAALALAAWSLELTAFVAFTLADLTYGSASLRGIGPITKAALSLLHARFTAGDFLGNLAGRAVALTFGITLVTYYINNYAVLSPRDVEGKRALWTEVVMRSTAVSLFIPVMLLIVWDPAEWALLSGASTLLIVVNNYLTLTLAKRANRIGQIFSTRGVAGDRFINEIYREWWILMGAYSGGLLVVGVASIFYPSKVVGVLAILVCVINLGKMYRLNCTKTSPQVRGNLARDFLTLRRVAAIDARQEGR